MFGKNGVFFVLKLDVFKVFFLDGFLKVVIGGGGCCCCYCWCFFGSILDFVILIFRRSRKMS